jgi:hypothetical protein
MVLSAPCTLRYLIRNLWRHVRELDGLLPPPRKKSFTEQEVVAHMLKRFRNATDILVMQDGRIIRDVVEVGEDGKWTYLDGYTHPFLPTARRDNAATVFFAWGNTRDARTVFGDQYFSDGGLRNVLIHPVIEWRGRSVHFLESLQNDFGGEDNRITLESVVAELFAAMRGEQPLSDRWVEMPEWKYTAPDAPQLEEPFKHGNVGQPYINLGEVGPDENCGEDEHDDIDLDSMRLLSTMREQTIERGTSCFDGSCTDKDKKNRRKKKRTNTKQQNGT